MFEILLIIAQCWMENQSGQSAFRRTASLAEPVKTLPERTQAGRSLPILCLSPEADFRAIVNQSQSDSEPTSALSALGIDRTTVEKTGTTDLPPVTKELAAILDRWEAASRGVKSSQFEIQRTIYNLTFELEQRSEGDLFFESPDKVSVVLRPTKIPKGVMGARVGKSNGRPFRLESGRGESWIWTANELAMANDEERTYERYQVAPPSQFLLAPSFLLEMSAEKIRKECELSLLSVRDDGVVLRAVPRTAVLKQFFFSECLLLINNKTWQLTAAKYFDPTGNLEIVYKIEKRIVNQPLPANCFDPALKWEGYKQFKLE